MTLANKITIARLVSVPFVLWALYEAQYLLALCVFAVAAVSDGVDGYIARKYSQQTVVGSILDPLADKLLLTMTFVALTFSPNVQVGLPAWLTAAVLYRDLLIMLGSSMVKWFCPTLNYRAIVSSKLTTFFQIVTVLVACLANLLASYGINPWFLQWPLRVLVVVTAGCCAISALGYYRMGVWALAHEAEEPSRQDAGQ
ncbi:CDP-alcohol phosphatidyltransferase family protein [Candidatus Sumerlaeota bacterium]|nr:CDP-alcohol phosphatidyltransferase family protein [Candidatus Sumerlaeota bacterium]